MPTLKTGIRTVQLLLNTSIMQSIGAKIEPPFDGCKNFTFDTDEYWKCYIQMFTDPGHHPVSTCKMGSVKDDTTVVDNKLRYFLLIQVQS